MNPETKIPGLKSGHAIITVECRTNRGRVGAFDEAASRLRKLYDQYSTAEGNGGVDWHLVLVRGNDEKPPTEAEG